jgi:hypothetical protein
MTGVIATVDIADLGAGGTIRSLLSTMPKAGDVDGLRWANVAALVPLAATRPPTLKRAALYAMWDDDEAARRFSVEHPLGQRFAGNALHVSMRPIRAFGSWPGLGADIEADRDAAHDGPVVVLTMGRLRISQTVRFLRTSRAAERGALESPGMRWGTASARPPFVATISVWDDGRASATYAYGRSKPAHDDAITEQQRKDFHTYSAFVRFAPVRVEGAIDGSDLGLGSPV